MILKSILSIDPYSSDLWKYKNSPGIVNPKFKENKFTYVYEISGITADKVKINSIEDPPRVTGKYLINIPEINRQIAEVNNIKNCIVPPSKPWIADNRIINSQAIPNILQMTFIVLLKCVS